MKKTARLCAMLIAVLGAQVLSAQTDVTSTYLTNADFASVDGWTAYVSGSYREYGNLNIGGKLASYAASTSDGTHLSTEYCLGFQCRWDGNYASYNQETSELPAGVYTLSYDVENVNGSTTAAAYNNLFYVKVGDRTFTDTSTEWMKGKSSWTTHSITFVITEPTKATISLGYGTGSNNIATANTPVLYVSHLNLTHRNIDDISAENPADLTSYIVNNSFETGNLNGWTVKTSSDTGVKPNSNGTYTTSGVDGNYLFNTWWQGTPLTQTVANIPNGIYVLNVLVASGDGADKATPNIFLLANGEHSEAYNIADGNNKVFHDVSYEFKVLNGQATIGVVGGNDAGEYVEGGHWWYKADNFRLTYKGVDLSIVKEAYETALTNAKAARDNGEYTGVVGVEKTNLVNAINLQPAENKSELEAATTALLNATTVFTASKSDYDALATEKEIAKGLGMSEESIVSVTATTKTGLVALQDLKVAEYNYIQETYTESATLGSWTEDFKEDLNGEGYKANGSTYFNEWGSATRTAKQTVKLPAGDYAISSIGRGQVGTSGYLYYKIGEETTTVDFIMKGNRGRGVDVDGVANFSDGGSYNCNGEGFGWEYRFITFHLDAETEVEMGVSATFAGAWVSIYAPVLLTTEASVKALRMTEIANLLSTVPTGKMNATVQAILTEKKEAAEAANQDNSIEELTTIAGDLNEAIIAANASVAEYEKIAGYIAKANTIDESIAAGYQSQYENGAIAETTETVFQNLEVATYNYVTANFTYAVALSDEWESSGENTQAADFSNEHWSGETRFYKNQDDNNGQGWNASAWSLDFAQDVTLPAGEYVFKVAGRKSEGATLQLVVTMGEKTLGTVSDFPNGSTGRGINKAGAASFDPNDQFTRPENTGFGWQWRYVKFTLEEEATVKIAVHAEANQKGQWVSFGDYTLQMTEETYLEANKEGLNAALEPAQELADDDIMGDAEREALQAAINMPVTTGAEMKAKIDALNLAVANANVWVAAYNEAKAPLTAALERVPSYTDEEGNSLNKMQTSVWNAVIEAAEAAAMAKDVTNSYEGFADAAENLNSALDAADASIEEYAALKTKIDEATVLTEVNVGDQPFQRSAADAAILSEAIATATGVYNAATAGGEDMTAATDALEEAIATFNNTALNAPAEGQRFYIKVAIEGHGKVGNALLATLGTVGDNNPTGYGLNANYAANGYMNQAFIFTQIGGNLYNISIERPEGTVYLTYGSLNGSAAGWSKQQIQATTDADKKGEFKIEATAKNGIHKIFNTVYNNYLDCQDGGSIYTDTDIEKEEFAFELAPEHEVTLSISAAKWATLILPFDAALPEGVKAYSCAEADGETLTLNEATSIVANTPYLVSGAEGTYDFSGYGMAEKDTYEDGLFVGTYVDYQTTANSNTYVLQKHDDVVAFYLVGDAEGAQPWIRANRCYMVYEAAAGAPMFSFERGEGTTSIDNAQLTIDNVVIYDLMGRKVTTMEKGNMYIVNGKKVIVK